jgi:hypothetical protein
MRTPIVLLLLFVGMTSFGQKGQNSKTPATPQDDPSNYATFTQLRANRSLPKWANTVCFMEKQADGDADWVDLPWNTIGETATDFFVYGPKGTLSIQTQMYVKGIASDYSKWDRVKGSRERASAFTTMIEGRKNVEGTLKTLVIDWGEGSHYVIRFNSTNTGLLHFSLQGHCRPI